MEFYRHKDRFMARMLACEDGDWRAARKILDEAVQRHQDSVDVYLQRNRGDGDGATVVLGEDVSDNVSDDDGVHEAWGAQTDPLAPPIVLVDEEEVQYGIVEEGRFDETDIAHDVFDASLSSSSSPRLALQQG